MKPHKQGTLDELEARQCFGHASMWSEDVPATRFAMGTQELDPERARAASEAAVFDQEAVAQIVHDLKNPLSTIALELCLIGDQLDAHTAKELAASIARIGHNVVFVDRMIQDLLDSCSIDAGRFDVDRSRTELRTLLEQVIERAVPTRDRARVFLEAPRMVTVSIDALRIERVVANLLANALEYAPRASGIVVRLDVCANLVRISVIDVGTSLTPADQCVMFDKYRRARSAQSQGGSGLGLYVSRKIVEAHGGRIDVECVRGTGTRFFFELPIRL